ncbi:AfsR/SARP family transcriptional regulator [Yoonia sp. 2307UL14-13]|uniref:AfsR/SARP family transcriptional regulator n=1 Tax=Yoonia sp. 2307UL14-13 TaxID=3126506 RepID=UPI0030B5F2FB
MLEIIQINLLGEVAYYRGETKVPLITSRKTRALLIYLVVTGRSQHREHLCEMFFAKTADPRGALRWSLSKLRRLMNTDGADRLISERDYVAIDKADIALDIDFLRATHGHPNPPIARLRRAAQLLSQKPFPDLDLRRADEYQLWLIRTREALLSLRGGITEKLAWAPQITDAEALRWLRQWHQQDPFSHDAPFMLWRKLMELDRIEEAQAVSKEYLRLMETEARDWRDR